LFGEPNAVIEMRGIGLRLPASSTASTKAAADRFVRPQPQPDDPGIPAHEDDEVDVVLEGSFPATYTSGVPITRFVGLHANPTGWLDHTPGFFSVDRSAPAVSVSVFGDSGNDELMSATASAPAGLAAATASSRRSPTCASWGAAASVLRVRR